MNLPELIERLRGLNAKHPPFGAAHEAADALEELAAENVALTLERDMRRMAETRNTELLAKCDELAAALAVKDEALNELAEKLGARWCLENNYAKHIEALTLQPHAALVNKIKADAVRGAKPEFVVALLLDHSEFAAIFGVLDHVADRIEKGEA